MTSKLLHELAFLFRLEADTIVDQYAWPPRPPLSDDELREVRRLDACSRALNYRGNVAAYEGR